jgi:hypothetical protein
MELFYWTLLFGLSTMLLGAGLMAALVTCTMDNRFRLVVRLRRRLEEECTATRMPAVMTGAGPETPRILSMPS